MDDCWFLLLFNELTLSRKCVQNAKPRPSPGCGGCERSWQATMGWAEPGVSYAPPPPNQTVLSAPESNRNQPLRLMGSSPAAKAAELYHRLGIGGDSPPHPATKTQRRPGRSRDGICGPVPTEENDPLHLFYVTQPKSATRTGPAPDINPKRKHAPGTESGLDVLAPRATNGVISIQLPGECQNAATAPTGEPQAGWPVPRRAASRGPNLPGDRGARHMGTWQARGNVCRGHQAGGSQP